MVTINVRTTHFPNPKFSQRYIPYIGYGFSHCNTAICKLKTNRSHCFHYFSKQFWILLWEVDCFFYFEKSYFLSINLM